MAQTSDEVNPVPNLALQSIIRPALSSLGNDRNTQQDFKNSIHQLIRAFELAEDAIPGISQEILAGILRADGYSMNINEILLRCSYTDTDDFQIEREEPEFLKLEKKANELKAILGKIPEEIQDRSKFLQTIKDIASAIRELLDSVNQVLKTYQDQGRIKEYRKTLEQNKREFVKYSKSFSDTLKQYFKDLKQDSVFLSANCLINQTNNILIVFRMVGKDK
ncbi:programmed cell death protein 10-like [Hydractinia symbiolongicarpus]|uniref:programmed cell death protein 10-like n=1 Tax=Hydractinia symbiolongicarpus TaxID=13093 RepID=UPI00254D7F1C|nr:programmed cell death protein 10-like [Hydractinia symbiolongicarpus]